MEAFASTVRRHEDLKDLASELLGFAHPFGLDAVEPLQCSRQCPTHRRYCVRVPAKVGAASHAALDVSVPKIEEGDSNRHRLTGVALVTKVDS